MSEPNYTFTPFELGVIIKSIEYCENARIYKKSDLLAVAEILEVAEGEKARLESFDKCNENLYEKINKELKE